MWAILLAVAASAAELPIGIEGGLGLATPHAGLGPAVGLRALGEMEVVENVWSGLEVEGRFPGAGKAVLTGPELANDTEVRTGQTALSLGVRGAFTPGDLEGLRWRFGGALGTSRMIQGVRSDAGRSREAITSFWFRPEVGAVYAIGPGYLTPSLYWSLAPARLDTLGGTGSVGGLMVGYRAEI